MNDPFTERLENVVIGDVEPQTVVIEEYDPAWSQRFRSEEGRIWGALGERVVTIEHIGSTAVPGLAGKPIVDVLLVVADSADEQSYVPALEAAGYVLRVREPDHDEHRMFRTAARDVHVHVFSRGSQEIERYTVLRDRLREQADERELYVATKRELAKRRWPSVDHYAVAKTEVIEGIIARAGAARPAGEPS